MVRKNRFRLSASVRKFIRPYPGRKKKIIPKISLKERQQQIDDYYDHHYQAFLRRMDFHRNAPKRRLKRNVG